MSEVRKTYKSGVATPRGYARQQRPTIEFEDECALADLASRLFSIDHFDRIDDEHGSANVGPSSKTSHRTVKHLDT